MLVKRIIPCLDVKDGRVVKGVNFVNLRDAGDPVEIAAAYEKEGADELTFLDITASHEKRNIILDVVARTAEQVFMPLTVGGGVRTLEDIRNLLKAGADKVAINSAAVKDPTFVQKAAKCFGSQCIVVAIDAKQTKATADEASIPSWTDAHPDLLLNENDIKNIVKSVIDAVGATSMADMGKIMPEVMKRGRGLIDGKTAQKLVQ